MKCIELETKTVTEVDVSFMTLDDITLLLEEVQSEVFKYAKEKKRISTLPACKKDNKTLKKLNNLSEKLMSLQEAQCWIGRIKKQKRDSMAKEKAWFHQFYVLTQNSIRKGVFDKLVEQTNIKMQYSINC